MDFLYFTGHPLSDNLPLISGYPWKLIALFLSCHFFTSTLGPRIMANRSPFDLKPILLIYYGLVFGANGAGVFLDLWVTNLASISFDCSPIEPHLTDLKPFFTVYLAYIFLWLHVGEILPRVITVLMKKPLKWDKLDMVNELTFILAIAYGIKYFPGKASSFLPLVTLTFSIIDYGFRVCASAGPPVIDVNRWQTTCTRLKLIHATLILIHGLALLTMPSCSNILSLSLLEIISSSLTLINVYRDGENAWTKAKCLKDD